MTFWKSPLLQAILLTLLLGDSSAAGGGSLAAIDNFLTGYSDADVCALQNKKLVQFSSDLGLLYIYEKDGSGAWVADQEYRGIQVSENPKIAVDGDTVVIAGCSGTGMACILEKNQSNALWSTNATATAVPVMNDDNFDSVSISDGTIVFGSAVSAKAIVFAKNDEGLWKHLQTIDSPNQVPSGFGQAVRVLGDYMVISAVANQKSNHETCGSLLMTCMSDDECCSGLCTGRDGRTKKCRFCARKKELCSSSSECCQSDAGRYCDPVLKQCLKCPASGCPTEPQSTPYGQVFAYKKDRSSGKWSIEDENGISSPDRTHSFGQQVDLTSTKIIIGAPGKTPAQAGYVAVYKKGSYKKVGTINGMAASFGSLVAADDKRILVSSGEGTDVSVYSSRNLSEDKNSPISYSDYPTSLAVSDGEACVGISNKGAYVDSHSPVYQPPKQVITQPASGVSNFFGDECAMDAQGQTMVALGPYGKEVYIYDKTESGTWELEGTVQDPLISFAPTAAVEGDTIVYAGCGGADYNFCILERQNDGKWPINPIVIQPIKGDEGIVGRISAVTISEGTIFIGVNQATWRTFLYTKNADGDWVQVQEISPPTPGGGAFGQSLHVLGDTMVIGSPAQPIPFNPIEERVIRAGEAYVYGKNTSSGLWEYTATLQAENPKFEDRFGWEVAITNSLIIVGVPAFNVIGSTPELYPFQPGYVQVYNKTSLEPLATLTDGNNMFGDRFGWRVAGNDDKILVGTMDNKFGGLGTVVPDASDDGFGGFKMYIYSSTTFEREVTTPVSFPDWPFSFSMGGGELCVGLVTEGHQLGPGPVSEDEVIVGDTKKVLVYNLD